MQNKVDLEFTHGHFWIIMILLCLNIVIYFGVGCSVRRLTLRIDDAQVEKPYAPSEVPLPLGIH